jgi:hypothetical protein
MLIMCVPELTSTLISITSETNPGFYLEANFCSWHIFFLFWETNSGVNMEANFVSGERLFCGITQ